MACKESRRKIQGPLQSSSVFICKCFCVKLHIVCKWSFTRIDFYVCICIDVCGSVWSSLEPRAHHGSPCASSDCALCVCMAVRDGVGVRVRCVSVWVVGVTQ